MAAGAGRARPAAFSSKTRAKARVAALAASDKFNGTPVAAQKANGRASQQWRLFRLRLNVLEGPAPFGAPQPLAGTVNSPGNELHPVLSPDGNTLYFARTKFAGNTEGNADSGDAWLSHSPDQGQTWGAAHAPRRHQHAPEQRGSGRRRRRGGTLLVRGTYERDGSFRDEGLSRVAAPPPRSRRRPKSVQPRGRAHCQLLLGRARHGLLYEQPMSKCCCSRWSAATRRAATTCT